MGVVFCPKRGSFVFIGGSLTEPAQVRRKFGESAFDTEPEGPEKGKKSKIEKQKEKSKIGGALNAGRPGKAATKSENKGEYKENEYGFL